MGQKMQLRDAANTVESHTGVTHAGMPLSANRPPAPDLEPWVGRVIASKLENAGSLSIDCGICSDLAFARVVLRGQWDVKTIDGMAHFKDQALLYGPHTQNMRLTCTGPVHAVGLGFRPGAITALLGRDADPLVDRMIATDPFGLAIGDVQQSYRPDTDPEQWLQVLEARMRDFIERTKPALPDPIATAFERASFDDPNIAPCDFAEEQGISQRQLERIVKRDFGMPPKMVLRRARALDLAAQLCGVADGEEESELLMRYFDQSHLIRDFKAFFETTPKAFNSEPRTLLRISLETRQARRLAELNRIGPGEIPPWVAS
ncbi:MAG: helix-turn-helix domain-containing protein [Erythrobacter sp.]